MIIGIDPGFTGAIAFLDKKELLIKDMPLHKIMGRNQVNGRVLRNHINAFMGQVKCAVIEDVHSMPGQGVVSTFRFGYNAGIILGVLEALEIDILMIKPAVWKCALGLSSDKSKSLKLARKTFPDYTDYFKRTKDDGRAEAALIAYFAKERLG